MIRYKTTQEEYEADQNYDHRLIPEGWQRVTAYEATVKESQEKKYPQINLKFDVLAAIGNPEWVYNDKLFHTITLIPLGEKGHGIGVHWLKCLGLKPDANGEFIIDDLHMQLCNKEIEVYVFIDEYQGKKRNKISRVKAIEATDDSAPAQQEPEKDVAEDDVPF